MFKNSQIENLAKSLQLNAGITQNGVGIMSLGLVMIQANELLQLIKNNPTTNLIQIYSKEQPTLITNNYATHSSPTTTIEVLKSLDSLRLSSIKGYLEGYLQELDIIMQPSCDNNGDSCIKGGSDNTTLLTIKTNVESILNALNSNQAFNSSSIQQDLSKIISAIQGNTIGANNKITDSEILQNGYVGYTSSSNFTIGSGATSDSYSHAYLTPSFGIQSLMLFQMLQGISENKKDVNYAYALGSAFNNFKQTYYNYFFENVYNGCNLYSSGNKISCFNDSTQPARLRTLIKAIDPSLITTYNTLGTLGNKFFANSSTGNASVYQPLMTELKKQISTLNFSNDSIKENDKQQALSIIDKFLTDISLYDTQTSKNTSIQFSAWINNGSFNLMHNPISADISFNITKNKKGMEEPSGVIVRGEYWGGANGNTVETYPTKMSIKDLYNNIMSWWDNVGNMANALNSHNPKEIGKAIQSFGNFYNTMWKENKYYEAGKGSYPDKNQIKQILSNINKTLPTKDQVSQNTFNSWTHFLALPTLSQQHQATYNTLQSSKPIALASLSTLANMFNQMNYLSSPTTTFTNNDKVIESKQQGYMLGFGIKGGYKQMFNYYIKGDKKSKKKYGQFGLRYYAFLDYNYGILNQRNMHKENMNMLSYGVGLDILVNVFENKLASYGIFGGFQIAGNSWLSTRTYSSSMKDKIKATHFQFLFDFGLRTNIARHHDIELGVKIPMLSQRYIDTANLKVNYKREFVYYVGYLYGF
ncbi:outer membrane protein [Helicobacter cetorum]|uniref:Outer membrane protein HopF, putative signal peptide n=1 Tax=Helicobacter cetorum (strain ATCC BAA-540 / CCUG 52418 / MIT 99-5656) TaxID=1163745 RepID=I0ETX1_HELCM|nr:outer membrane protein [Helicobacter cetorum]AFI06390.1 Outer membrane protein HopF, putative signal peptide [Helicobacter cetorum MIT 99-5656]